MGGATILTVEHSNGSYEGLLGLLDGHAVDVVVDVRSTPVSRFAPHFSGEQLRRALSRTSHRYLYMGDVLGGRPTTRGCTTRTAPGATIWWPGRRRSEPASTGW